jgi:hypothetical protein
MDRPSVKSNVNTNEPRIWYTVTAALDRLKVSTKSGRKPCFNLKKIITLVLNYGHLKTQAEPHTFLFWDLFPNM